MSTLITFNVSDVIAKIAEQQGLDVEVSGIDDVCYGVQITSDMALSQFLSMHQGIYNFQIVDGDPIRVIRRAVNDSLTIDASLSQEDLVARRADAPAVAFTRSDPAALPRTIEIQYIDPERDFAVNTQTARYDGAPATNPKLSLAIAFTISADQARALAYDWLYRIWSQQLSLSFETRTIDIEPGDTVALACEQGTFTLLVQQSTITRERTNQITATALMTAAGITIASGQANAFVSAFNDDWSAWAAAAA